MTSTPTPRTPRWLREKEALRDHNRAFNPDFVLLPNGQPVREVQLACIDVNAYCLEQFNASLGDLIEDARQRFELTTDNAIRLLAAVMDAIRLGEPGVLHQSSLRDVERDLLACAHQDYSDAKMQLGLLYCSAGKYFGHTEEEGLIWMLKAFKSEHSDAAAELGVYYLRKERWDKAAQYLRKGDKRKCAMSAFMLARMYHEGAEGFEQDIQKAFKLYGQASMRGYPDATVEMVELHLSDPQAFSLRATPEELLREAIADGLPRAMCWLAYLFEQGHCVQQDLDKAVKLYQQAADHGFAVAQLTMGDIYQGIRPATFPVSKDIDHAIHWYERAADNPENDEVRIRAFLALGDIGMKTHQYERARDCFLNATRFGSATGHRLAAQAAHLHDAQQFDKGGN